MMQGAVHEPPVCASIREGRFANRPCSEKGRYETRPLISIHAFARVDKIAIRPLSP
jgi:hypothetical protein